MSESYYSQRFEKTIWITNHAIESMNKRAVTLDKAVVELGAV